MDSEHEIEVIGVLEDTQVTATTVGEQGPPGRNGTDGATISPDPSNQLSNRPDGLYVPPPQWGTTDW